MGLEHAEFHLRNAGVDFADAVGDELGDVANLERSASRVDTSTQVHDATLVVGDDRFRAG